MKGSICPRNVTQVIQFPDSHRCNIYIYIYCIIIR